MSKDNDECLIDSADRYDNNLSLVVRFPTCVILSFRINILFARTLTYENVSGVHTLSFGLGYNAFGQFPDYDLKYAASAAFRMENTLLVKVQIIDSAIGNLFFSLNFKGDYVTVMLRKIEESLFGEYNGVFSGKKI